MSCFLTFCSLEPSIVIRLRSFSSYSSSASFIYISSMIRGSIEVSRDLLASLWSLSDAILTLYFFSFATSLPIISSYIIRELYTFNSLYQIWTVSCPLLMHVMQLACPDWLLTHELLIEGLDSLVDLILVIVYVLPHLVFQFSLQPADFLLRMRETSIIKEFERIVITPGLWDLS